MGLLDKLLKIGAEKLAEGLSEVYKNTSSAGNNTSRPGMKDDWEMRVIDGKNVYDKLENCFSRHFSDYRVRMDVKPQEFGGNVHARNFTYVLYLDGDAKAVVMVTAHNHERKAEYRLAKQAAEAAGLPFINFFSHFDNREEYVFDRLSRYLRATA